MILGAIIKLTLSSDISGDVQERKPYTLHVEMDYYKRSGELTGIAFDVTGDDIYDYVHKAASHIPGGTLAHDVFETLTPWIINWASDESGEVKFKELDLTFDTEKVMNIPNWFRESSYDEDMEEAVNHITGTELAFCDRIQKPEFSLAPHATTVLCAIVMPVPTAIYMVANKFMRG